MENLTTLCRGHHGAVHSGEITITGKAPRLVVTRVLEVPRVGDESASALRPHVGEPLVADALRALTTLGFSKREARAAIDNALAELHHTDSLEQLVRAALRAVRGG